MFRRLLLAFAALLAATSLLAQPLPWVKMPGGANDIGVGPKGEAWVIGTDPTAGGFGIYRLDGDNWTKVPGGATRISVGPTGPWITNSEGTIFRWDAKTNGWEKLAGAAWDIGVGANGVAWVIGTNKEAGGYGIYRWNAGKNNWDKVPGSAVRIAVDRSGNAVVVNLQGEIFAWAGLLFMKLPGAARDVGTGADGSMYIVGTDGGVYQWAMGRWIHRDGALESIAVDHKGQPWGTNAQKEIWSAGRGGPTPTTGGAGDVTAKLEKLGIANNGRFANKIYPRNPWDMKAYRDRIYIGSGNSNNEGPDPNAGPVDVTYFDPASNKFGSEWQVNDEQIDAFRIVGSTLAIPGHDPREDWRKGNFYRKVGDGWQEVRTVSNTIHMYDITERSEAQAATTLSNVDRTGFSNKFLFAAIATPTTGAVAVSANNGSTWTTFPVIEAVGARARTFLHTSAGMCVSAHINPNYKGVNNVIQGVTGIFGSSAQKKTDAWMVTSKGVQWIDSKLFPGLTTQYLFAAKPVPFNSEVYYFAAYAPIDHNWKSEGFFATKDCKSARRIGVAGKWFHHAVADGGKLYVMTSDEELGGRRNRLFASTDGTTFKPVLNFAHKGFARSFAILNGDFYFGIGSEAEAPHPETGAILRIKAADVPKP